MLNGTAEEGVPVHVRGQVTETGGGLVSIRGEVMFNHHPPLLAAPMAAG